MIEVEYNWVVLSAVTLAMASTHLWFPWFDERYAQRTSFWMGLISGIAAGYVVLYMLPKIARITAHIVGFDPAAEVQFFDLRMYYLMLFGMIAYLVMLHLGHVQSRLSILANAFDYFVHGLYSLLLGYVFVEISSDRAGVNVLIGTVMGLHLLGMNHVLRSVRTQGYDATARWVYFLFVLLGAGLGLATELPKQIIHSVTAFLSGIILVFVIAEEMPIEKRERVPWFMLGVALFVLIGSVVIQIDSRPAY